MLTLDNSVIRRTITPLLNNTYDIGNASKSVRSLYLGTSVVFTASSFSINASTSDGSDNKLITISGGGASGAGRGGFLEFRGNEAASSAGLARINSGDVSGARVLIQCDSSNGSIDLSTGGFGSIKYSIDSSGNIIGDSSNAGDIQINRLGKGLKLKEGSNARLGQATLVGGTVTVSNTSVTSSTRIFTTRATTGGTAGHLSYTISAGVSFTINSSSGTDTSVINYLLIEGV